MTVCSGVLVSVTCAVGHHVRNSLLLCSQIHSEQGNILYMVVKQDLQSLVGN